MASPLAEAHIEAERRLRALITGQVGRVWQELPGYDRENVDQWLSRVLPLIDSGQRASVALTEGYIARALERQPLGLSPEEIIERVRNGTPPAEAYERPFIELWSKLGAGVLFADASSAALARAQGMAAFDVQGAMARTAQAVGREDAQIQRWQRVANPGACTFCGELDGAVLLSEDALPIHNGCGCGIEPLLESSPVTPVPDTVAVNTHGEMGAVLGAPEHSFTSAADIPAL